MNTYQLVFSDDGHGEAKTIEFDAEDAAEALIIAHSEAPGRSAELWRDDEMLCAIRRREIGYWELTDAGGHAPARSLGVLPVATASSGTIAP